jgi:hypothetical protein
VAVLDYMKGIIPASHCKYSGKPVRIASNLTKIQTRYLLNTGLRYNYTNSLANHTGQVTEKYHSTIWRGPYIQIM